MKKKKILIGSVFTVLVMLSMPMISNIRAQSALSLTEKTGQTTQIIDNNEENSDCDICPYTIKTMDGEDPAVCQLCRDIDDIWDWTMYVWTPFLLGNTDINLNLPGELINAFISLLQTPFKILMGVATVMVLVPIAFMYIACHYIIFGDWSNHYDGVGCP